MTVAAVLVLIIHSSNKKKSKIIFLFNVGLGDVFIQFDFVNTNAMQCKVRRFDAMRSKLMQSDASDAK